MAVPAAALDPVKVSRRVQPFGPDDCLLGSFTKARGAAKAPGGRIGAVLWGLGVAEVKTARRLAARGIPSLQVRINNVDFQDRDLRNDTYGRRGVEFSRYAMDHLQAVLGVERILLMGNCATAGVSFNAALHDQRVTGLILTNPFIARKHLLRVSLWRKLAKPGVLRRLTRGDVKFAANLRALFGDKAPAAANSSRAAGETGSSEHCAPQHWDYDLPGNFATVAAKLVERGTRVLLACAQGDDSYHYMDKKFSREFARLSAGGRFSFERVETGAHVFSRDDGAASLLNDIISRWIDTTDFDADFADGVPSDDGADAAAIIGSDDRIVRAV